MKKYLIAVFILIFAFYNSSTVFSAEGGGLNVKVDHLANPFEKGFEKLNLFMKFKKEGKIDYILYLLEKRAAELAYIANNHKLDDIEPVASRYNTYVLSMANFMVENNLSSRKDKVIEELMRHRVVIEELHRNYDFESGWWLAIQHDINSIDDTVKRLESLK